MLSGKLLTEDNPESPRVFFEGGSFQQAECNPSTPLSLPHGPLGSLDSHPADPLTFLTVKASFVAGELSIFL